jgi:hypothetical protein
MHVRRTEVTPVWKLNDIYREGYRSDWECLGPFLLNLLGRPRPAHAAHAAVVAASETAEEAHGPVGRVPHHASDGLRDARVPGAPAEDGHARSRPHRNGLLLAHVARPWLMIQRIKITTHMSKGFVKIQVLPKTPCQFNWLGCYLQMCWTTVL